MTAERLEAVERELEALAAESAALTAKGEELSVIAAELEDLQVAYTKETRQRIEAEAARDALQRENAALRARVEEFEEDARRILNEDCAPDEKHCSCVPHLRARVAALEQKMRRAAPHVCPECGPHVLVDEEACCASCGADTELLDAALSPQAGHPAAVHDDRRFCRDAECEGDAALPPQPGEGAADPRLSPREDGWWCVQCDEGFATEAAGRAHDCADVHARVDAALSPQPGEEAVDTPEDTPAEGVRRGIDEWLRQTPPIIPSQPGKGAGRMNGHDINCASLHTDSNGEAFPCTCEAPPGEGAAR